MTAKHPAPKPRHGDTPEEQPATPEPGDVERESAPKGMSRGRDYPSEPPENRGAFDPATTQSPKGGGQG